MIFAASGTLEADTEFQYNCTLVRGEAFRQFESLSVDVYIIKTLNVDYIIRGLAQYFFPVNFLSEQKCAMLCGIKKPCSLTIRHYEARLNDLNEHSASFPG